jgi:hypothetical protein
MVGTTPAATLHKSCHSGFAGEVVTTCPHAVPVSLDADTLQQPTVIHGSTVPTTTEDD